jgi:PTH1 family peptidyl-tRNA hydrolase
MRDDGRIALIAGLGNPGPKYDHTRHNVGFEVVDELARRFQVRLQERKFQASWGMGVIEGHKVLLCKPLTFMNRSGEAVSEIVHYFGFSPANMLVVHDDLDLPCGRIRLARRGGAGGHRGVQSVIDHLRSRDFPRLKLGIGRPQRGEPVEAFVLHKPSSEEEAVFREMVDCGVDAVQEALLSGLEAAMSRFNRRDDPTGEA